MEVRIKLLDPKAKIPFKKYDDDFCYDCYATSCEEVAPHVFKYGLGIALQIKEVRPKCLRNSIVHAISIRPRSSIWKTGMVLSNSVGTIDFDYTGEISAVFYHVLPDMPRYKVGDRICQLYLDKCNKITFDTASEFHETKRRSKGYGSTGKR